MPWVKYDDGFSDHPKTLEVRSHGLEAVGLHVLCGTWSAKTSRPGYVPEGAVIAMAGGNKAKAKKLAGQLVAARMWHLQGHECSECAQPEPGEYVVHDWAHYNPTGSTNEALSAARSEAGRKGAEKRWGRRDAA